MALGALLTSDVVGLSSVIHHQRSSCLDRLVLRLSCGLSKAYFCSLIFAPTLAAKLRKVFGLTLAMESGFTNHSNFGASGETLRDR